MPPAEASSSETHAGRWPLSLFLSTLTGYRAAEDLRRELLLETPGPDIPAERPPKRPAFDRCREAFPGSVQPRAPTWKLPAEIENDLVWLLAAP